MVLGFGEIAGADRFNSEVLAGTIQGVTGNSGTGSAGCYTGNDYIPQQQGTYRTVSDSSNAFASP
ncbi:MAG: hypothetical protein R3B45_12150 [Bdellovibrionota bacterium]